MSKKTVRENPLESFLESQKEEVYEEEEPQIKIRGITDEMDADAYTTKVRLYEKDPETQKWAKESVKADLKQRGMELKDLNENQMERLIKEKIINTRIPYDFSDEKLKKSGYSYRYGGKSTKKMNRRRSRVRRKSTKKRRKGRRTRRMKRKN